MKNVCLIVLSLIFASTSFAQTKKTNSSISVSHEEKRFSLNAHFSVAIDGDIRAAIIEEISKVLELEPEVRSNNAYVWEDKSVGTLKYSFRLNNKRCKIKIEKKVLSRERYEELCELGEEVGELLSERNNNQKERSTSNSCTTKTETKTRSKSNTKSSDNGFMNFSLASSDRGRTVVSVAISENDSSLDLAATFSKAMSEAIVTKIKVAVDDRSTDAYKKQLWKDNKSDGGYLIEMEGTQCNISLNKKNLSATTFEKLEKLCLDIANMISNGG